MKSVFRHTLLGILLAVACTANAADSWPVKITPDRHVGQTYGLQMELDNSIAVNLTVNGESIMDKSNSIKLVFDGTVAVTAVNDRQLVTGAEITVKELTLDVESDADSPRILTPAGTVIIATTGANGPEFSVDGEPVTPQAQQALSSMLFIYDGRATADEVYGTSELVKPGDTWTVNKEKAAENTSNAKTQVTAEDVDGTVTVTGTEEIDGQQCLKLHTDMTVENLTPPRLPPDLKVAQGVFQLDATNWLPVNASDGPLKKEATATITFNASGENEQGPVVFHSKIIEKRSEHYTY